MRCDLMAAARGGKFYLLPLAHLGTILDEARHGEGALRTKKLAFRPATAYAFPVVYHESWHSVARTDGERASLMLTYYVQDGVFGRLFQRLMRVWLFLAMPFANDHPPASWRLMKSRARARQVSASGPAPCRLRQR